MKEFVISEAQTEKAVLVGLITQNQNERKTNEYLDELAFLAETAGAEVVTRFTQKLDTPNSVTYVGKGKLQEIKDYLLQMNEDEETEIGMVIFDDELSAKQLRNIENELKVKILDRTSLILDIFAMRAQTANAKTQVELAQYKYMLPRLQRLWTHLERQGGGSGAGGGKGSVGLRGPGETQLEMDRRIILNRMSLLKQRLAEIDTQKSTQRKNRGRMIRVALVGYTNVGKSTIMNLLAKSEVFAENKLFATLDTTVRKVIIENLPFLFVPPEAAGCFIQSFPVVEIGCGTAVDKPDRRTVQPVVFGSVPPEHVAHRVERKRIDPLLLAHPCCDGDNREAGNLGSIAFHHQWSIRSATGTQSQPVPAGAVIGHLIGFPRVDNFDSSTRPYLSARLFERGKRSFPRPVIGVVPPDIIHINRCGACCSSGQPHRQNHRRYQ